METRKTWLTKIVSLVTIMFVVLLLVACDPDKAPPGPPSVPPRPYHTVTVPTQEITLPPGTYTVPTTCVTPTFTCFLSATP